MGDMRGRIHPSYSYMYRWPDCDLPGGQHRQYEITAALLGLSWDRWCTSCDEDMEKYTGNRRAAERTRTRRSHSALCCAPCWMH